MHDVVMSQNIYAKSKIKSNTVSIAFNILKFVSKIIVNSLLCFAILLTTLFFIVFIDEKINKLRGKNVPSLASAYVIVSPSMVPTIHVQDAVVVVRVNPAELKVGDIITFKSSDSRYLGYTITHRIKNIVTTDSGQVMFITKGDNNSISDGNPVLSDDVYGKVVLKVPYLGFLQHFLFLPIGFITLIILPCLIIISVSLFKYLKNKKIKSANFDVIETINSEQSVLNFTNEKMVINENGNDITIEII